MASVKFILRTYDRETKSPATMSGAFHAPQGDNLCLSNV